MNIKKRKAIIVLILSWCLIIYWFFHSLLRTNSYLNQCGIELLLPLLIKTALVIAAIIICVRLISNFKINIGLLNILLLIGIFVFFLCNIMNLLNLFFVVKIGEAADAEQMRKILLLIYQKSISVFVGAIAGISIGFLFLPLMDILTLKKKIFN